MKKIITILFILIAVGVSFYMLYQAVCYEIPINPKNKWSYIITVHQNDIMGNEDIYLAKSVKVYKDSVCFIDTAGNLGCLTGDITIEKVNQ